VLRTMFSWIKNSALLVLLAGLAACQAADGTSQSPDTALVNSIMTGLGAVDPNAKPIDYKPRAPLAMPAEPGALPEPETKVAGTESENWPKQQENAEYEELKELYATSGGFGAPLTPEQMRGFKITGVTGQAERDRVAERRQQEIDDNAPLTRQEQKQEFENLQAIRAQQTGLAEGTLATRRYLTEPPTAYSTPSPDAPMPEVVSKSKSTKKPSNYDPYSPKPLDPRCLEGEQKYCN